MHTGEGFVFHLDLPREQPDRDETMQVAGWLAALEPIADLRLAGARRPELTLSPRPDVQAIFPGYPHVIGFLGTMQGADLVGGALRFAFSLGARGCEVEQPIPLKPAPIGGVRRWLARADAALARRALAREPSPATRWNAGLRLLRAQVRLERGEAFGRIEGERIVALFAETFPDAFLVQIGANDGTTGDPLVQWFPRTRWRALLVEPIGHLAAALRQLHASRSQVVVERAAISDTDGHARIYRIAHEPGRSPVWHQLLATFDRDVLLKHRAAIPDLESLIVEETVETLTVATLLARHQVERIDLLVIDTEGHDFRILRQFDFGRVRPVLIIFEHQHLRADEKAVALSLLRRHGYRTIETPEGDTFAWRRQ